ncbi:MAG TPA: acyl-CoA dehydrogenase family protein [Solirubrobacteraceae bacterium]|jgi:alkylation response protein AidB-like acyl-CoA dehydrogenase|nr:acyl-CoA dehydrogenase family protein [Solirubrobacteraceae bacterium]
MNNTATEARAFSLPVHVAEVQAHTQELAARFADRHREVRLHPFEHGELHPELWGEISDRGWPGLLVPGAYGGTEGGLLAYLVVMEALAARNLILWMPVLSAAISYAIAEVGPESVRERWLPRVASGGTFLALAVTEPDCGHNVFRTQTTVRRDGERFVINGFKAVTSGIDLAERVLVFGRAPSAESEGRRFTTVLVDPGAAGVERSELPMRWREGARQFQLTFKDVEVPADALVGAEGQGLLALWPFTHVERLMTAALCLGNARYCVDRALARAGTRTIFGKHPIGAEQAIQHPIASLHARIAATQLLVYRAAAEFDARTDPGAVAAQANMTKVLTADLLFDAADHAMQTLGAQAWDEREGMIDLFLDARAARSAPISQELALNFIAQHELGLPSHR